jgi:Bacterial membrane protein YfhO
MSAVDWRLVAVLVVLLALLQAACFLLARGLGLRLRRPAVALGLTLPLLLLAPWLVQGRLLVPCNLLRAVPDVHRTVPEAPPAAATDPYDVLNDVVYQLLPWELEVRHALAARRLPFWSDAVDGGCSLWANPQAGAASPLAMLARGLPIQHHLLAALALKLLLAFEGTWLLCRRLGRSRAASLLAAGAFALGGALVGWGLYPISSALAWVPWLAVGTIGLCRRPRPRAVATTALIAAALLLSGHPETAAIGGLFAAVCGLALAHRRGLARGLLAAGVAAALGFALAAPHLLPFLHLLPGSHRAQETLAETLPPHHFEPANPLSWFLSPNHLFLVSPLNPHVYGRPFRDPFRGPYVWPEAVSGYAGLLLFAAALAALAAWRDRRVRPFLLFFLAALLVTARWLPFAHLAHALPPLRVVAWPRFLGVGALALVVAGAFGLDRVLAQRGGRLGAWIAVAAAAALSLAVHADAWVLTLWLLVAAALLAARWSRRFGVALAAVALLVDLVPWSRSLLPSCPTALFYPRTELTELLAREAGPATTGRAAGALQLLFPSLLPVYGIADPRPHNPLAPVSQLQALDAAFGYAPTRRRYFPRFANVDHPLLDFLNVRALVGSVELPPPRTLDRIDGGRFGLYQVYRNPDALPRWFLTDRARAVERRELRGWIEGLAEPREVALPREAGAWRPTPGATGGLRARSLAPGRLVFAVPPAGEKLLATSLPAAPGWRVRAEGGAARLLTIDGAFVGVAVPAGVSRVELAFVPAGFLPGLVAACAAAVAVVALLLAPRRRRHRPGGEQRQRDRA